MKKKSSDQLIFPILVGGISALNILRNFQDFYLTSILVSIIGLIGTLLFFKNNKFKDVFFYSWILLQLITYSNSSFTYFTNQFPYISLSMSFNGTKSIFAINFVPLFYFIGFSILKMYDLIGKTVSVKPIKAESNLVSMEGEIVEIIKNNKDGNWYKVNLGEQSDLKSILIKPKGPERFSSKKSILAFVKEGEGTKSFIDWGKVKIK